VSAEPQADELESLAALDDPKRRRLYRLVAERAPGELSRDEAAALAGVSRSLAAFHLDRLVDAGLLEANFRRLSGRAGPGAGRPAKLYRRAQRELSLSFPPRDYALAGRLLASAIASAEGAQASLCDRARELGKQLGTEAKTRAAGSRAGADARLRSALDVLRELGFEPTAAGTDIHLHNCPFHALAQEFPDVLCVMNVDLLQGLAAGAGLAGFEPRLDPAPGRCCVVLKQRSKEARRNGSAVTLTA
jgi:predicted ArsR family transcriptional regulator